MRHNILYRLFPLGVVLGSIVLGTPSAAAEPEGGCPPPFDLMRVDDVVALAEEIEDEIRKTDLNEDDFLCVKFARNDPDAFTFTDNRRQGRGRP